MRRLPLAAFLAALLSLFAVPVAGAQTLSPTDEDTVTISGKAYVFNHMDTFIPGATIRVREIPGLSTTTDANGDYSLQVPSDATITPYIDPPDGYNQVDLQTFRTRGEDIENANFQTPADLEYNALAVLLGVPFGPDGRPERCVIVSTASARNVRGVDYPTFVARTPHGVAGATAKEFPRIDGPTYFNASVIPDPMQLSTSEDGGMIWTGVPNGAYRIATTAPTTAFAGFLATCEPGRVINANPPWGAYELRTGEKPLASGVAVAEVRKARIGPGIEGRPATLYVGVRSPEALREDVVLREKGGPVLKTRTIRRTHLISMPIPHRASGTLVARIKLTDRSGGTAKYVRTKKLKR